MVNLTILPFRVSLFKLRLCSHWVPEHQAFSQMSVHASCGWTIAKVLFFICYFINCSFEQPHSTFWMATFQILAKSWLSTGAWVLTKNNVMFRHWVLYVPKYCLAPEFKVEALCPDKGSVPEFWCEYLEKINGLFT